MNKAIVYIEEMDSVADVTFPAVPQVISLLMYDDTAKTKDKPHPPNGYPVVCVTVSPNPSAAFDSHTGSVRFLSFVQSPHVLSVLAGLQPEVPRL